MRYIEIRILCGILLLLVACADCFAVPAERIRRKITLIDGQQVEATLLGNEDYSFYLTDNGYVVEETENGYVLTDRLVTDTTFSARKTKPLKVGTRESAALSSFDKQRVPVILVSFADKPFSVADTREGVNDYYDRFCNGTMDGNIYTGHGSHGSIRDYFIEQSDSLFFPEFTVIGPVTLDHDYAYYGKNSGNVKDLYFNTFRDEAVSKAMHMFTDWSIFDNNKDGEVDMVFFVYAGLGENNGGDSNTIWPKESSSSTQIHGMTFATSAATCECRPSSWDEEGTQVLSTRGDGIGVFVHELSHALGLPDFYDTKNVAFGMDLWSIMDYGEYGNNGFNPGGYTAYERDFLGWRQLVEISEACTLHIPCFADGGLGYKIVNDLNEDEYYVIENRQAKGWDDKVCSLGHGLQVTHVDYVSWKWTGNIVNTDPDHQHMTIIAANNNYRGTNSASSSAEWKECLAGNLFPGNTFNYELTDYSLPASEVFVGKLMHKPIQDISEENDVVILKFNSKGKLDMPEDISVTDISLDGFTVNWLAVPEAECYRVLVMKGDEVIQSADSLVSTSHHFEGLAPENEYKIRVMALADAFLNSYYAECVAETFPDAVSDVRNGEALLRVFDMNGVFVAECCADELRRLSIHSGIYVIKSPQGRFMKILIN